MPETGLDMQEATPCSAGQIQLVPIVLPLGICAMLILLTLVTFGCFHERILQELQCCRSLRLKGRSPVAGVSIPAKRQMSAADVERKGIC